MVPSCFGANYYYFTNGPHYGRARGERKTVTHPGKKRPNDQTQCRGPAIRTRPGLCRLSAEDVVATSGWWMGVRDLPSGPRVAPGRVGATADLDCGATSVSGGRMLAFDPGELEGLRSLPATRGCDFCATRTPDF